MSDSLKAKTVHGLCWSMIDWGGVTGVQFVIGIVLARLLLPEQFGLIGMLTIFIAVAQSFLDSGFGSALIQKQDATHADQCSIFYFNIVVGVVAASLLCLTAPWIAAFFREPLLTPLCRVLSLNIVINSLGLIQTATMVKRVDFKTQAKISILTVLISGTVGVTMAMYGFGVWSLAAQSLASNTSRTLFLWLFNVWRPSLIFSFAALRKMFAFGSRLLASGLLETVFQNLYLLVIGRLYSATDLGFYTRANTIRQLPSSGLYSIVGRVTFPVFATVQNDPARMKRGLKKALGSLVFMNFPLMIGLAIVARPLVLVLFTKKWEPCIPYLQLLCIAGLLYPLHAANLNILTALGRSDLFFRLEIIKKIMVVASIAIFYRWGVEGLIYGQVATSFLSYFLNSYYTGVMLAYPAREQLADLLPYLAIALAMGAVVYMVQWFPFSGNWSLLLSQASVGATLYILLCRWFRLPAFMEAIETLQSLFPRAKLI